MIAAMIPKPIICLFRRLTKLSSRAAAKKTRDPTAALETLEWWSWRATIIILVGIVIEAWDAIHFRTPGETGFEVLSKLAADLLVGFGLAIEAICILRAIVETRKEKRESDEKIATANERTVMAEIELERLRKWVVENAASVADALLTSAKAGRDNAIATQLLRAVAEQIAFAHGHVAREMISEAGKVFQIIPAISAFAGKRFDAVAVSRDISLAVLLGSLRNSLIAAGWIEIERESPTDASSPEQVSEGDSSRVLISVDTSSMSEIGDAARALASALTTEGIEAGVETMKTTKKADNIIHIQVVKKTGL